jgi:hypothetical protein
MSRGLGADTGEIAIDANRIAAQGDGCTHVSLLSGVVVGGGISREISVTEQAAEYRVGIGRGSRGQPPPPMPRSSAMASAIRGNWSG